MPKRLITPEDLLRIQFVGDPQLSPDGQSILFALKRITDKNAYLTHLHLVDLKGKVTQLTQGETSAASGRWSPDGGSIAFVSGRDKPSAQIFLLSMSGGEAVKKTSLPEGTIGALRWSPDGKYIAFTFRPTHPLRTETAKKEREEKGLSTPPWEIDTEWYRLDGDGYFGNQRYSLHLLEVATGKHHELYSGSSMGHYDFDWAPDSSHLAVAHSVHKQPFREPTEDQIYMVSLKGKAKPLKGVQAGSKGAIRFSPDGKWIAYLGNEEVTPDWGTKNNRLYVVSAEGGPAKCLTDKDDYCLSTMTLSDSKEAGAEGVVIWAEDGKSIYLSVATRGEVQLGQATVDGKGLKFITKGNHVLSIGPVSVGGNFACTYGDATHLNEVALVQGGKIKTLTSLNHALLDEVKISEPTEFELDSTDGSKLHGWVLMPPGHQPKDKRAAILQIHGGPHTQYGWAFFHEFQVLAAAGYIVFYTNPRGSKGYGEAHCEAIRSNWGVKDWEDVQTVTRYMQHHPNVAAGRMGVMGGSYGGYMTNWVIGHCKDYKAAITDRCVSNLVSMAGSSDFPMNEGDYFGGCSWGTHAEIEPLWRQSPLAYFKGVTTPTLVIHSEGDLRCNIEQAEQVYMSLQMQGIPTRFVRYPSNTSHGMSRIGPPDLRLHRLGEILSWWKKWL